VTGAADRLSRKLLGMRPPRRFGAGVVGTLSLTYGIQGCFAGFVGDEGAFYSMETRS
jgi:hypothetical protein